MFNLFRRQSLHEYSILYRLKSGTFFLRHTVRAANPYEACRLFDTDPQYQSFIRVSGATINTGS